MAKITQVKKGLYGCRFWYNDFFGKQKSKYKSGFHTKREANDWATIEKLRLENSNESAARLTFGNIANQWLALKEINLSPTTLHTYKKILEFLQEYLNDIDIKKVNEDILQEIVKMKKSTPRYCHLIITMLSGVFNYAIRKKYIRENPTLFLELPKYEPKEKETFDIDAAKKLIDALRAEAADPESKYGYLFNYTLLSILFSFSRAEVCARKFSDIRDNLLHMHSNYVAIDGKHIIKSPKAKSRRRKLNISDDIIDELKIYHNTHNLDTDYICCFKDGQPMHPDSVSKGFASFLKKYKFRHIPFKNLRHSFGNITLEQGGDLDTLKRLMGHSRITTTSTFYLTNNQKLMNKTIRKTQKALLHHATTTTDL